MRTKGVKARNAPRRGSTKGDRIYKSVPRANLVDFDEKPRKGPFDHALFPDGRRKMTGEQWSELLIVLNNYRFECGYPFKDNSETVSAIRARVRSVTKSLASIRKKLENLEGPSTSPEAFPRTIGDLIDLVDAGAVSKAAGSRDLTFPELLRNLDALVDRLGLIGEWLAPVGDYRFPLGTHGIIRTQLTPWVRMVSELEEWWFEVFGQLVSFKADGPFLRLVGEATSAVGQHFKGEDGRGVAFQRAVRSALGAKRY